MSPPTPRLSDTTWIKKVFAPSFPGIGVAAAAGQEREILIQPGKIESRAPPFVQPSQICKSFGPLKISFPKYRNVFPVPMYKNALRRSYYHLFCGAITNVTERGNGERERHIASPFFGLFFSVRTYLALPYRIGGKKAVNYGRDAWGEEKRIEGGLVHTRSVEARNADEKSEANSTNTTIQHPKL